VSQHPHAQRLLQRVGLPPIGVVLAQPRRVAARRVSLARRLGTAEQQAGLT